MKWWGGGHDLHPLRWLRSCTYTCHIIKPSKLQKCFLSLQGMREEAGFRMFFEKVNASKRKLEIDDLELPSERKISSHYVEGEAPVEFASTVEEH